MQSFPLLPGKNIIGRLGSTTVNSIAVDDEFMSRAHAVVEFTAGSARKVLLYDIGEMAGNKPSTNGVYLNGNKDRLLAAVPLTEGDAFQVGYSKFVLTYEQAGGRDEAVSRVVGRKHVETVLIKVH